MEPVRIDGIVMPVDVLIDYDHFRGETIATIECRGYHSFQHDSPIKDLKMTLAHDKLSVPLANAVKNGRRFRVVFVEMEE